MADKGARMLQHGTIKYDSCEVRKGVSSTNTRKDNLRQIIPFFAVIL